MEIRYAFRDDPLNAYLLSEGSTDQYTQIIAIRKKAVAPGFLKDYYYLDSRPTVYSGMTEIGRKVFSLHWKNPLHYIVKVDCQLEITPRLSTFEKLQSMFFPLWTPETNTSFFGDQPSGFLTVLRVYQVKDPLPEELLKKGRLGSSQIMRLYDEIGEATCIETEIIRPVLSENRFSYIKDELIYALKKQGALIANYENTPEGCKKLQAQIETLREIAGPQERTYQFDPDAEADYAQSDYPALYREIKQCAPNLANFVDYVASQRPPQFGEIAMLHSPRFRGKPDARKRMIEMHMRVALKCGMWLHKRFNFDLEDVIQTCMLGLITAVDRFSESPKNAFSSYAVMWMRQISMRDLYGRTSVYMPTHIKERFSQLIDTAIHHDCPDCMCGHYCEEMLSLAEKLCNGDRSAAIDALNNVFIAQSLEQLAEEDNYSDNGTFMLILHENLMRKGLCETVSSSLLTLKDKAREVLIKRYGLTGVSETLEQVGQEYGLTRERVRQIESSSLRRLEKGKFGAKLLSYWEES